MDKQEEKSLGKKERKALLVLLRLLNAELLVTDRALRVLETSAV